MPLVNGHHRLLSLEDEEKLRVELTRLWNHHILVYRYEDIAAKLQFGVPGTPFEKLRLTHVDYYCQKFGLHARPRSLFYVKKIKHINKQPEQKKTAGELAKQVNWKHMNRLQLATEWEKFDGTWTEFLRYLNKNHSRFSQVQAKELDAPSIS